MTDVTRSEYCAVAIADCFADDGEIMGSPMGLLPTLGARLAKNTSNPTLMLTDGEARILRAPLPSARPPTSPRAGCRSGSCWNRWSPTASGT